MRGRDSSRGRDSESSRVGELERESWRGRGRKFLTSNGECKFRALVVEGGEVEGGVGDGAGGVGVGEGGEGEGEGEREEEEEEELHRREGGKALEKRGKR